MAILLVCSVLVLVTVASAVNCPTGIPKDSNIINNGSKCYEFVLHHRVDWAHAAADCTRKGGNLVSVESMAEQTFIMTSLKNLNFHGHGVWIGLNDKVKDGQYEWANGKTVNFTNWARGQPGGLFAFNEDCVLLNFRESGHWHDYKCADQFLAIPQHDGWICEYIGVTGPNPNAHSTIRPIVTTSSAVVTASSAAVTTRSPPSTPSTQAPTTLIDHDITFSTTAAPTTVPS